MKKLSIALLFAALILPATSFAQSNVQAEISKILQLVQQLQAQVARLQSAQTALAAGSSSSAQLLAAETVSLTSVNIQAGSATVVYSKNFSTCAHLKNPANQLVHTQNHFCTSGNQVSATVPLSALNNVSAGSQLKLCLGNNGNLCSGFVAVGQGAQPSASVVGSSHMECVPADDGSPACRLVSGSGSNQCGYDADCVGRSGASTSTVTSTPPTALASATITPSRISLAPGESRDLIFTFPEGVYRASFYVNCSTGTSIVNDLSGRESCNTTTTFRAVSARSYTIKFARADASVSPNVPVLSLNTWRLNSPSVVRLDASAQIEMSPFPSVITDESQTIRLNDLFRLGTSTFKYTLGEIQGGVGNKRVVFQIIAQPNLSISGKVNFVGTSANRKNSILGVVYHGNKTYAFRAVSDITKANYDLRMDLDGDGYFDHSEDVTSEAATVRPDDIFKIGGNKFRYLAVDSKNPCFACSSYARFWGLTSGWTNSSALTFTDSVANGTITLDGKAYKIASAPGANINQANFNLRVDLNGNGEMGYGTANNPAVISVAIDSSSAPAKQVTMGSNQNPVATFLFTETTNIEDVKITDLTVFADTGSTTTVKAAFNNLTLTYNSGPSVGMVIGTSGNAVASNAISANGTGYHYTFHFANPLIVPKSGSVSVVLKADVASFSSSGATDNSTTIFKIATTTRSGLTTNMGVVVAAGSASNVTSAVSGLPVAGNAQTVLRSSLTVSGAVIMPTTGRARTATDDVAKITFTPNAAGGVILNTVSLVLSGGATSNATNSLHTTPTQQRLLDSVRLIDDSTGQFFCNASISTSSLTASFSLSNCSLTSAKVARVRFDSTQTYQSTTAGAQQSLSFTMNSTSNVGYTTALSGGTANVALPANALPLNVATVSYTD